MSRLKAAHNCTIKIKSAESCIVTHSPCLWLVTFIIGSKFLRAQDIFVKVCFLQI